MTDTNEKHHKIFYGWWIVAALFFIAAYVTGIVFFGFTAILDPIASEFGWSYTQISLAASLRGIESGLLSPLVGWLIEKWGPRKLLLLGITITGIGLLLLSKVNSLATFYSAFFVISIGLSICTNVIPMTVVGYWFRRRVSIATGIVVSGTACGGLLVPLVTGAIDTYGWRIAMTGLGIGALVIFIPVAFIIRHKPEQYGLLPDGDTSVKQVNDNNRYPDKPDIDIEVKQVIKKRIFWFIGIASACHLLIVNAVVTHVMTYLGTAGIARASSSIVASAIPIISIAGRLSFGWFGDRFDKRWVMVAGYLFLCTGLLIFNGIASTGTWLLFLFIIFFGLGYGGPIPIVPAILREYFGRAHLGTLIGFILGITMVGSIIGPPLAGWFFDTFHSYKGAWFTCAGIAVIGIICLASIPSANKVNLSSDKI
jgi:sugar phosphate permease